MAGPYKLIVMDPNWPEKGGGKSKRGADRWYECASNVDDLVNCVCGMRDPEGNLAYHPDTEGCQVWIWTTMNKLPMAMELIHELNLTYITMRVWVKADVMTSRFRVLFDYAKKMLPAKTRNSLDKAINRGVFAMQVFGLGQYIRGQHELAILAYARGGVGDMDIRDHAVREEGQLAVPEGAELLYSEVDDSAVALLCRVGRTRTSCRRVPSVLLAPRTNIHSEKPAQFYRDALMIAGGGPAMEMFTRDPHDGYASAGDELGTAWREKYE